MHIRVLLSKYRSYTPCPACGGARLKLEALLWRLGSKDDADAVLAPAKRFMPVGTGWGREQLEALPGLTVHDLMLLPIDRLRALLRPGLRGGRRGTEPSLASQGSQGEALHHLHDEIRTRLRYLCDVGIGYLTLDRQSRTLSGGEVQRINLTTALGTSLVNTLFVLDEPSIGLHPRDMGRIVLAMHRLRDAGNTLVVVEHDPAVMLAADRLIDMGPGPGERGGSIVFDGTPEAVKSADTLTGAYLGARKQVGMGLKRLVGDSTPRLILEGARDHNLKDITVEIPAAAPGVRDRRLGLGQEHAGPGHPGAGAGAALRQGDRDAGRARRPARRRLAGRHGVRRPEPDRQDRALQPGELRRRVRRDPEALRARAAGGAAQLRRRHVQLQRRQRPLPDLRRLGLRARRDAVPQRRVPALPGLRRPPVPCRDPRRDDRAPPSRRRLAQPQRRRRPRAHRRRGGAAVPRRPRGGAPAAADRRRRPRVREARPAGADAFRRRGAAPQARRLPRRGGAELERQPAGAGPARHALHVRRADHRAALRRHRQADALVQEAPGGGPLDRRHRAQPRRHPRLRLADRPRPRGRRGRRRAGRLRHAGGREAPRHVAHRQGAARLRRRPRLRGPRGRGRAAAAAPAQAGARAPRRGREHPHRQRPRAQPEVDRRLHSARQVQRHHRRVRLGQVDARLRHPVQRGPAPLPRVAQRLRPLDRPAGRPARGRRGLRHPADRRDRAAAVARREEEHGRHHHRGLAFPAPALRQARGAALRQGRHRGAAAERRADRGADPARPCRRACRRARAAGGGEKGRLHRPRQVGQGARPQPPARRRRVHQGRSRGRGSTASRSTPSSCRSAT